ncbi:MAG: hypothetical protein KAI70_05480, partial [Candidatus Omnitrophica bacterium]|nr:hypothetical protein [Candidatus Omnitrophota bacterium]
MSKKINLTGKKFGRLIVIKEKGRCNDGKISWECLCVCGKIKNVCGGSLRQGLTLSCGCLRTKHGISKTPTYKSWADMIQKCNNSNNPRYKDYGGRGIKVEDPRWFVFEMFFKDMGICPDGLTIDRINNEKGYCKKNCHWTTRSEQSINQRLSKRNTSGTRGVDFHKQSQKYRVRIMIRGEQYNI